MLAAGTSGSSAAGCVSDASVRVSAITAANRSVIPCGRSIGVILCANGAAVTEVSEFETTDGRNVSPAKEAGISAGDVIVGFDEKSVASVAQLNRAVECAEGRDVSAEIMRRNKKISLSVKAQRAKTDDKLHIGVWVKDAYSGIGTLTFYDPSTHRFAALGHGISDSASGELAAADGGSIFASAIVSVKKGARGEAGELKGVFGENGEKLGSITQNSECGIFGVYTADADAELGTPIPVAAKSEVRTGDAYILSEVEPNKIGRYKVEITRIMPGNGSVTKGMAIKICDEELAEKTGGIVRGMSGSPIIQDGKLIGAVTHVFLNNPMRGYGIFAENMLNAAED